MDNGYNVNRQISEGRSLSTGRIMTQIEDKAEEYLNQIESGWKAGGWACELFAQNRQELKSDIVAAVNIVAKEDRWADYAHPESLVSTDWVMEHGTDPKIRLVEVDVDTDSYDRGHIAGAVGWNWRDQLQETLNRDLISKEGLEKLLGSAGIDNDTIVIIYGDNNNWFAAWAFWQLKYYGHDDVKLMNGGRAKWEAEGKPLTNDIPNHILKSYTAKGPNENIRAYRDQVLGKVNAGTISLVDVRAPAEYSGELLAPENLPQEGAQRGGHIPSAANIPWGQAVADDGSFKSASDLRAIYGGKGIDGSKEIISYCRIGERSSHTWFVLTQLLGHTNVRNYDGSWTEWGNIVGAPIEK